MNRVVAIVGMCGSGKSVACEYLENKGYKKVYFGGVTMDVLKKENKEVNPENEKEVRERLRREYGMSAYAIMSLPKIEEYVKDSNVVIDGLYSWEELKVLKEKFPNILVLAIVANKSLRYNRLAEREIRPLTNVEANTRDVSEIENLQKGGPIVYADYYILNNNDYDTYMKDIKNVVNEMEEL